MDSGIVLKVLRNIHENFFLFTEWVVYGGITPLFVAFKGALGVIGHRHIQGLRFVVVPTEDTLGEGVEPSRHRLLGWG